MTDDRDNAGEVVAGAVRVALTAAGQLAEQAARRREANLREAERDSTARAATVRSQIAAERAVSLQAVRDITQRGDVATVEEVVHAWKQARSWDDPTMAMERAQLENRIRDRFGLDARGVAVGHTRSEQAQAATLVARDLSMQADDVLGRCVPQDRVAALQGERVDVGMGAEAAAARALAAVSHPTPVGHALRRARTPSISLPKPPRSRPVVEWQGRDR